MNAKIAKTKLLENLNNTISLEMTNSLGYKIKRKGKLEYHYMYKPNKSGSSFCVAIDEKKDLDKIISINIV